jgi:antitoxin CcdA
MMEKPEDAAAHLRNAGARRRWLEENATAFAAQAHWHEQHPHPLADIILEPREHP